MINYDYDRDCPYHLDIIPYLLILDLPCFIRFYYSWAHPSLGPSVHFSSVITASSLFFSILQPRCPSWCVQWSNSSVLRNAASLANVASGDFPPWVCPLDPRWEICESVTVSDPFFKKRQATEAIPGWIQRQTPRPLSQSLRVKIRSPCQLAHFPFCR